MDVAIGLPATIPGVTGEQVTEWARRADKAGFSSLGTIDRIAYPNYEPLTSLAAAAAVTERIRLATTILLLPIRNATMVAKQAATIQQLSNGRMVLGVAPGGRPDDFEVAGASFDDRGPRFDDMLKRMREVWDGDGVGPATDPRPQLLLGGSVDAAFRRAAEYGDGWIMGGGTPEVFADGKAKTEAAWEKAGREGKPALKCLAYFALGDGAEEAADWYLHDYYGILGDEIADSIASSAATDADTIKGYISAFEEAGADEFFLFPCKPDPEQVDLLAEVAL
jgi:alkanesulfonate monooxygenase SsuD/methylene tetrahydromethanopterin reductase-like flavin-dependent oxidoreductase (luciferase family)